MKMIIPSLSMPALLGWYLMIDGRYVCGPLKHHLVMVHLKFGQFQEMSMSVPAKVILWTPKIVDGSLLAWITAGMEA